jgi:hypothetical protein
MNAAQSMLVNCEIWSESLLRFTSPYRHVQRLHHHVGGLAALHRPAHHAVGVQIDHDSQIVKAFQGANVSNVCHPGSIWRSYVELTIQSIIDRQRRPATIAARPTHVVDLCPDAGQLFCRAT